MGTGSGINRAGEAVATGNTGRTFRLTDSTYEWEGCKYGGNVFDYSELVVKKGEISIRKMSMIFCITY